MESWIDSINLSISCTQTAKPLIPGSAPTDASKLGPELAGGAAALLFAVVVAVAARRAVGTLSSSWADTGGAGRARGLFVGSGDNFGGEVEPGNGQIRQQ
jgi:hypothetical protein